MRVRQSPVFRLSSARLVCQYSAIVNIVFGQHGQDRHDSDRSQARLRLVAMADFHILIMTLMINLFV